MAEFDPYHVWLGIPSKDQPPNHYRLLAIELLEDNADVIATAADRQMVFLRTFQSGKRAAESQRLLNEISAARGCLLDAAKKAAYDEQLVGVLQDVDLEDLPEVELLDEESPHPQAAPLLPPSPPAASTPDGDLGKMDDYQLLAALDKSSSGAVLKAKHLAMGRVVAIKVLSREAIASEQLLKRFQRKIKILARLNHPNLLTIHTAGRFKDRPYMVMEFIDGRNLAQLVKQCGPLPIEHAINYTLQAATGLGFAHERGVYHRNVKPSNLMVHNETGLVKVIGLGMARLSGPNASEASFQENLTTPGTAMGTFDYMAPEQYADASRVDHRADIYSLGCTFYAIATGQPPFPDKSPMKKLLAHRDGPIPPLHALRPDAPAAVEAAYQKMLAKKPEDRFQSMAEVVTAFAGD